MLKKRLAIVFVVSLLAVGAGVASALGKSSSSTDERSPATAVNGTTATDDDGDVEAQVGEQDDADEQAAANDVGEAADEVEAEADNTAADDVSGDQQGPNDDSEEQGDDAQGD